MMPLPEQPITDAIAVQLASIRMAHFNFLIATDKQTCSLWDHLTAIGHARNLFVAHINLYKLHYGCLTPYGIYRLLLDYDMHMPRYHHNQLTTWLVDLFWGGTIADLPYTVAHLIDTQFLLADSRRWHGYPWHYSQDYLAHLEAKRTKT